MSSSSRVRNNDNNTGAHPKRAHYFFVLPQLQRALFALGNLVHYLLMARYKAALCPVFGCCLRSAENWILREMPWCSGAQCLASECCLKNKVLDVGSVRRLSGYSAMLGSTMDTYSAPVLGCGRISHIFYVEVDSN